jgi:putative transposase
VLRHEVTVLAAPIRPHVCWPTRAVFAALIRRLPTKLRGQRLVTPRTILRWITAIVTEHQAWRPGTRLPSAAVR